MTTITLPRATVEQALEVINDTAYGAPVFRQEVRDTIDALRAALAQPAGPVQEQDVELSAALGWPGGISNPVLDRKVLLQKVAALAQEVEPLPPLWPPTGLEPRGCPLPGACPSESVRSTHSEECWQWHQACAVAAVIRLRAEVARMSKRDGE